MSENLKPPWEQEDDLPEPADDGLDDYERAKKKIRLQTANNIQTEEPEKTPETRKEERHAIDSFEELLVRAFDGRSRTIKIWDKSFGPVKNHNGKESLGVVDAPGEFVPGNIHKIRMPYELVFDVYHPTDMNPHNKNRRLGIWGGHVTRINFDSDWSGKIDLGKDYSGHDAEYYAKRFKELARGR